MLFKGTPKPEEISRPSVARKRLSHSGLIEIEQPHRVPVGHDVLDLEVGVPDPMLVHFPDSLTAKSQDLWVNRAALQVVVQRDGVQPPRGDGPPEEQRTLFPDDAQGLRDGQALLEEGKVNAKFRQHAIAEKAIR